MTTPNMADLPRPKVEVVTTSDGKDHVVVSRPGDVTKDRATPKCKSYEIRGVGINEKIQNIVTDVLNDRSTGEFLP